MKKTILVGLLLTCGTAEAANWVSGGKTSDGITEWFVDTSSIQISKSSLRIDKTVRHAWIKTVFAPHSMKDPALHSGKWLAFAVERVVFDCVDETADTESITQHYESGGADSMPDDPKPLRMVPVSPDTVLQLEMRFVCSWKPN